MAFIQTTVDEIKTLIATDISALKDQIKNIVWNPQTGAKQDAQNLEILASIAIKVSSLVESANSDLNKYSGDDKKESAVQIIQSYVDVPGVPAFIERMIIVACVDGGVTKLNKLFGNSWFDKVGKIISTVDIIAHDIEKILYDVHAKETVVPVIPVDSSTSTDNK